MSGCTVFIGNLDPRANERDLEIEFDRYGRIRDLWLARKPPGFAFVEFDDHRDASDAVRGSDGRYILNNRVRVEISNKRGARAGSGARDGGDRGGDRGGNFRDDRRDDRDRRGGGNDRHGSDSRDAYPNRQQQERKGPQQNPRRTEFRVKFTDLPTGASWQKIKDNLRELGCIPVYCDVFANGVGAADFNNDGDADYVVSKLDGKSFLDGVFHVARDVNSSESGEAQAVPENTSYSDQHEPARGRSRSGDRDFDDDKAFRGRSRSRSA